MGNLCPSRQTKEQQQAAIVNHLLDGTILKSRYQDDLTVKLLLLGAGESGKTTLFKQMRINYIEEYRKEQLKEERDKIISAFFDAFWELLKATLNQYGTMGSEKLDKCRLSIFPDTFPNEDKTEKVELSLDTVHKLKQLWHSDNVQYIWENRSKYQVMDALEHFVISLDRMAGKDYQPTEEDYLFYRVRTTGIISQTFMYSNVRFEIVDVGGQRSERRKWIQCFDNVTAVIFVAAVSEFDQKLFEDGNVDRITEAKELFERTLRFSVFKETPMILFLNKLDLFEAKLERMRQMNFNLDKLFPTLHLGRNYDGAAKAILEHLKGEFESKTAQGKVFTHFVTATDKDTFKKVFQATAQIILTRTINQHFRQGP